MRSSSILSLATAAILAPLAAAVCQPGEVGVAYRWAPQFQVLGGYTLYSGSIVANNCGIIASNGQTQDSNQWCRGDYTKSEVDCQGGSSPVTVRDPSGINYRCYDNNDSGCNNVGFTVEVCCYRT